MRQTKRRLFTGIFALAMVPLLAASAAYACQRLATAHANPNRAAAGSQVQVQGANYSKEATASNVDIRLDGRNGRVLASIAPAALEGSGSTGKFSVAVTVPADVAIGNHMLVVTQTLSGGQPCVGCPGRANLEVTAASASSSGSDTAAPTASQSQESQQSQTPAQASSSDSSSAAAPASEPAASQAATADPAATSTPASSETAPSAAATAAARPAAVAPAAVAPAAVAPVAPAPAAVAPSVLATATEAVPAAEAPATAAYESGSAAPAAPVSLLPAASGERPSPVPGLALAAALGLVLLGLAAFWKSGYVAFGTRGGFNTAS